MNREEAIKIVKSHYPANKQMLNEALEFLIPELKESEDEKIRKDLITFLDEIWHLGKNANFDKWDKCDCSNWIAWVNKQSEHEYTLKSSNMLDVSKLTDQITKLAKDYDFNLPNRSYDIYAFAKDILAWIEKEYKNVQGISVSEPIKEEKVDNANKVEPKFKVGDWIVWQDKCYKVNDNGCGFELVDQNGLSTSLEYGNIDENARLWDITKDAKDGDVLAVSWWEDKDFWQKIIIFKKYHSEGIKWFNIPSVEGYGNTFKNGKLVINEEVPYYSKTWTSNLHPASKEQCGLLFKSMKENGYEWESEQKQLKQKFIEKVETKFKDGDWIVYNDAVWKVCNISLQNYYELLKINNEVSTRLIKDVDENAHLWTINDAKPGDIIYAESKFAIFDFIAFFSKLENKNVWVYCSVCSDDDYYGDDLDHWEFDSDKGFIDLDSYKFYPASKELCDILFKSMKEKGYKWDGNIIKSLTTTKNY